MYRDENEMVRGQKVKLVLAVLMYLAAVLYSGRWLP